MNIETKPCTLCGAQAKRVCEDMSGYVEGTKYDVYECLKCLSSFVDPMSNLKKDYDVIYGGDTTKDSRYNYYYYLAQGIKSLSNPLNNIYGYSAIFWGVIKAVKDAKVKPDAKMLEVGCGLGYFTYAFNKAGYDCEGLDYSDTATDFANSFFGKKYTQGTVEDFSVNHHEEYDVVLATEVIEHVVDPSLFIEYSLKTLKSGGILIITTPNKDIHPKGTIWETNPAPEHLWWFTEKGIEAISKNNNVQVEFVDFTDYTKNKIWSVHLGTAHTPPNTGPLVDKDGLFLHPKKGYKERVMNVIPAWMYIKLVSLYHDLKFLQRNKKESRYMYGLCAVLTKK